MLGVKLAGKAMKEPGKPMDQVLPDGIMGTWWGCVSSDKRGQKNQQPNRVPLGASSSATGFMVDAQATN